jgi:hypothetical protein
MRVYLASRYSRHPEMRQYRSELESMGVEVTSRWINGDHEWTGNSATHGDMPLDIGRTFALEDLEDLERADLIVNFTEEARTTQSRGGRHVEFVYALGMGLDIVVVGHRENVFHCMPEVWFVSTWKEAKDYIKECLIEINQYAGEKIYANAE